MVVFDGVGRPADGAVVRVEVVAAAAPGTSVGPSEGVGEELARLAGTARGLPSDLAERHDAYRRERA